MIENDAEMTVTRARQARMLAAFAGALAKLKTQMDHGEGAELDAAQVAGIIWGVQTLRADSSTGGHLCIVESRRDPVTVSEHYLLRCRCHEVAWRTWRPGDASLTCPQGTELKADRG